MPFCNSRLVAVFQNLQVGCQRACLEDLLVPLFIPGCGKHDVVPDRRVLEPSLLGDVGHHVTQDPLLVGHVGANVGHGVGAGARALDRTGEQVGLAQQTVEKQGLAGAW